MSLRGVTYSFDLETPKYLASNLGITARPEISIIVEMV